MKYFKGITIGFLPALMVVCIIFPSTAQSIYYPRKTSSGNSNELIRELRFQTERELATIQTKRKTVVADIYSKRVNDLIKSIKQGIFIADDSLQKMVDDVMERLLDFNAIHRVPQRTLIQKNPEPNAFCYGEGTFVITVGLLAKMENESQLAFALAHELAHYELDHVKSRILLQVETDFSKQTRQEMGKLLSGKASEGDVNLLRDLVYDFSRFNREKEMQADSLGFIFFRNAGYKQTEALSLLTFLDTAQVDPLGAEVLLPLDAPHYPIQTEWLRRRLSVYNKKFENTLIFRNDSLSSHPDIEIRRSTLYAQIEENEGWLNYQNEDFFSATTRLAGFESVESAFLLKQYDHCLQLALELILIYPDDSYLVSMISQVLSALYMVKDTEFFSLYVPKYTAFYGAQLRLVNNFLHNLTRKELAEIGYHFLNRQSHFDEGNEYHYMLLWKFCEYTDRKEVQKRIKEIYFAKFRKGKFYADMK